MQQQQLADRIARELALGPRQVTAALALFDEGATLPFVARYRKEATGGLDEVQLRDVRERAAYLQELEARRATILASIEEQGRLDAALRARIAAAETKQALEDLYVPFRPKRRTRATIARERGLEPLAERIWAGEEDDAAIAAAAAGFVDAGAGVPDAHAALQGARDILAERVAEDADVRAWVRALTHERGVVRSQVRPDRRDDVTKFSDWYDHREKLTDIPSHRMLAIRRGEAEAVLSWQIEAPVDDIMAGLGSRFTSSRAARAQMTLVVADAYKRLLGPSIETDLQLELKNRADEEAIRVFGANLEQLLLAAPAGGRVVLGLDPGFRTGVKAAVASRTGAIVATDTLYLHQSTAFRNGLERLIAEHGVELIAIGNGTASRETELQVREVLAAATGSRPAVVVVNEAGASVYSASDVARGELPDLDVSLRGAASIARRLQDPLSELVKIDPKSIGVGQYQHDVNQTRLRERLDQVVQICVNRVGVEVNTASVSLLSYVAGVGPTLAKSIVATRDAKGGFRRRAELSDVPRLGARAFEQCAGFLRVRDGEHPLDASAVHPERYALVERIASDAGVAVKDLVADEARVASISFERYVSDDVGMPTLRDIADELRRPGRDPRAAFEAPSFRDDVRTLADLTPGMRLEGVVTNVVAFGAFVDVGVHQDGLVHVSQLADRFVKDPADVVHVGKRVEVTVLSVDLERNRIALSMRAGPAAAPAPPRGKPEPRPQRAAKERTAPPPKPGTIAPNGMRFR